MLLANKYNIQVRSVSGTTLSILISFKLVQTGKSHSSTIPDLTDALLSYGIETSSQVVSVGHHISSSPCPLLCPGHNTTPRPLQDKPTLAFSVSQDKGGDLLSSSESPRLDNTNREDIAEQSLLKNQTKSMEKCNFAIPSRNANS